MVTMAPELYMSIYKEQFRPPGKVKRAELRPTSAHRRNNPQPRPDFLFPHALQNSYRPTRVYSHLVTTGDIPQPLFPPVTHLAFQSSTPEVPLRADNGCKLLSLPSLYPNTAQALPSCGRMLNLQLTEPSGAETQLQSILKNSRSVMDNQRNANPLSSPLLKQETGDQFQLRPLTSHLPPTSQFKSTHRKCCSNSTVNYSGCNSCFHVVRPYQTGHYSIHPEFVSESLY